MTTVNIYLWSCTKRKIGNILLFLIFVQVLIIILKKFMQNREAKDIYSEQSIYLDTVFTGCAKLASRYIMRILSPFCNLE